MDRKSVLQQVCCLRQVLEILVSSVTSFSSSSCFIITMKLFCSSIASINIYNLIVCRRDVSRSSKGTFNG